MQQKQVSYLHMFNVFFKIGLFTIGGGLAMIPLIRDEFVERQGWIDDKDITDVLAIAQSLPGVIAVNSATFLGYRLAGIMGALVCTIGVVLPSFLIIFAIAMLFASSGLDSNTYILKFFAGVNAAITVLLVVATKKMFASSVSNKLGWAILLISVAEIYVWASALPPPLSRRRCTPLPLTAFWEGVLNDGHLLGFVFCVL